MHSIRYRSSLTLIIHPRTAAKFVMCVFGFNPEALLTDWLMTANGSTHDLLILSYRVEEEHE